MERLQKMLNFEGKISEEERPFLCCISHCLKILLRCVHTAHLLRVQRGFRTSSRHTLMSWNLGRFLERFRTRNILKAIQSVMAGGSKKEIAVTAKPKKKIRYAFLLCYRGSNYFGMQIQKEHPTIESNMLKALLECNLISQKEHDDPFLCFLQRASRTDRSVSAVRQICTIKLEKSDDVLVNGADNLNMKLPYDIRVIGIRRTTPSFHPQKSCAARTYSYTLPTFAFAKTDQLTSSAFRISDDAIEETNSTLELFVGTHNFFNYTSGREPGDKSCMRYVHSFECGPRTLYRKSTSDEESEFITLFIKGQSFMLHQIRKMMSVVIAVSRTLAYKSDIQKSFEGVRMDIPKAPGLGLVLEMLHYDHYDKRFSSTHGSLNCWGDRIERQLTELRTDLILNDVMEREVSGCSMMSWLTSLVHHTFSYDTDRFLIAPALSQAKSIADGQIILIDTNNSQNQSKREDDDETELQHVSSGDTEIEISGMGNTSAVARNCSAVSKG